MSDKNKSRRKFITQSAACAVGAGTLLGWPVSSSASIPSMSKDNINFVGPKPGYSPQVGTLVSMMNWMRDTILSPVQGLSVKELDYIHDDNSNSIGAMLWHLAATERFYQIHTFEGKSWGDWSPEDDKAWSTAMGLGDNGRSKIKGNRLNFYLEKLSTVRAHSLTELAKRDDEWLLALDEDWGWGPTNNYCKWFHVVEHESNHNGQIKWLKSRLPK